MARQQAGFTLVEALVAVSLAALAGSALLMSTTSSLQTTRDAQDRAIALALAQQLMDEVLGCRYLPDSGNAYATPIGPDASEKSGASRQLFDNIGDFNGYRSQPPRDAWGIVIGTEDGAGGTRNTNLQAPTDSLANWRQEVDVYYVSETNPTLPSTTATDYQAVEVRVVYVDPGGQTRTLASLRRVVSYVSPLP